MKKLSVVLDEDVHKELLRLKFEKAMADENISMADMIREAVTDWLVKQKKATQSR